jgi:hypothetical protein
VKSAIKLPIRHKITKSQFSQIRKGLPTIKNWLHGNVGVAGLPVNDLPFISDFIESAIQSSKSYKRVGQSITLLYGRGSMGMHKDCVDGLVLLTYLGSFLNQGQREPEYHGECGQFLTKNSYHDLEPGESIIFDDDEDHAWIHNANWLFASTPIKKVES